MEVAGQKLRYQLELVMREVRVPAERTAELRKFEGIIGADERSAVVLHRSK